MKKNYSLRGILLCLFLLNTIISISQSTGDISFIGFNTDGDKDFSVVILTEIAPNSTIYFTDDETNGSGGFIGSEGIITWSTGTKSISAGTVIVFTDVDHNNNPNFNVSIGSITRSGSFGLSGSKDGIIAYTGTNKNTPTTFISAIQIGNANSELGPFDVDGITLTNTGLTIGTTITIIDNVASPDGGKYAGSRSNQSIYSNYLSIIADKTNWTTVSSSGDGETLLPYSQEAFTIKTSNWTGAINSTWNLEGNWDNGIPTNSTYVAIPNVLNSPIISSGTEALAGNLTINANATLTINTNNSLTINGNITILGSLSANSASSIIIKGTSTGNISYSRTLTTNWHLLSSPVLSQNINTFTVTEVATNSIKTSGTKYGIAPYNNNGSAWMYYTTSTIGASGSFISGKGYSTLRTTAGNVTFTGTIPTTDISIPITDGTENEWNLIGNPYPSYIPVNSNADATNNFLTINTSNLNTSFQAVYFWNGSAYIPINHASKSRFIAPGQGFFVNSITNGAVANFTEAMQSHQTSDTFNKSKSTYPKITLKMTDGETNKSTEIKYIAGATTGLDPGFDAGMFNGGVNTFSVYSHLITNSNGIDFSLQVLPDNNYEKMIVPIGVNASSGKEITFSTNHQNLPTGLMIFLEDKTKNKIIRIDQLNSNYKIPLNSNHNGIGRFYLMTSISDLRKILKVNDYNLNQVKIFTTEEHQLKITGLKGENSRLKLYNILGKQLLNIKLNAKKRISIKIPSNIKQGIYIIKLENSSENISKKIFLK